MSDSDQSAPRQNVVMATYRVKPGCESDFCELLVQHGQLLRRLELMEEPKAQVFRRLFDDGRVMFVEIFTWRENGAERAHDHPDVRELWQKMSDCVAAHEDQPAMAFPHYSEWRCTQGG